MDADLEKKLEEAPKGEEKKVLQIELQRRYGNEMKSIEDVKKLFQSDCPMICFSNGYTSAFGYLISLKTKDFWTHAQWLIAPTKFASQWWYFTTFPLENYNHHSLKFWTNPDWTTDQKDILQKAIAVRLDMNGWKTRYDIWGVIGEGLGIKWMNSKRYDFCSESLNFLQLVDPAYRVYLDTVENSPTPEQVNDWLRQQKNKNGSSRYKVWGRIQPG